MQCSMMPDRGEASFSNVTEMSITEGITDAVNTAMTLTGSDGFTLVLWDMWRS